MPARLRTRPRCAACGRDLEMRVRAPAQAHLPREWVCLDLNCVRFGTFTRGDNHEHVATI